MPGLSEAKVTTLLSTKKTIRSRGRLLDLSAPLVMGILNATPDSFYTGSRYPEPEALLQQAAEMVQQGAQILDIGGYSTRPGASDIPLEEELARVLPAIEPGEKRIPGCLDQHRYVPQSRCPRSSGSRGRSGKRCFWRQA